MFFLYFFHHYNANRMCWASSGVTGGTGTDSSSLRPNKGHVKSASVSSGGPESGGTADPLRPRYEEQQTFHSARSVHTCCCCCCRRRSCRVAHLFLLGFGVKHKRYDHLLNEIYQFLLLQSYECIAGGDTDACLPKEHVVEKYVPFGTDETQGDLWARITGGFTACCQAVVLFKAQFEVFQAVSGT